MDVTSLGCRRTEWPFTFFKNASEKIQTHLRKAKYIFQYRLSVVLQKMMIHVRFHGKFSIKVVGTLFYQ